MPKMPSAEQLGMRPTPSPRGGIAQLQLSTPQLGQVEAAQAQMGAATMELGRAIGALAAREKAKNDAAITEEAYSSYIQGSMELEMGEDGYMQVKTGDAVKRPLMEEYGEKRKLLREKIREGLSTTQQFEFDRRAEISDRQFDARLFQHVATESRNYRELVHENSLETERRMAALYWQQPGQIELALLRTNQEILKKAQLEGLDPKRPEDRQIISNMNAAAESQIHTSILAQMLSQGQDAAASSYFNQVKARMSSEAVVAVSSKISTAAVEGTAIRAADDVWGTLGPSDLNSPVRLDVMEAWVRDNYGDNPTVAKSVIADLRSRATAHNDAQREFDASNRATVLSRFHDGASLADLQLMPEYQNLDGEARMQLRDYVLNTGWTEQQRARASREYTEGEKSRAGFRAYWELSNPAVLSALTEAQVLALEPEIGQELTGKLMAMRRELNDPSKVIAASIDTDMFNVIAAEGGLDPYKQKPSAEEKEYLGRLRHRVETVIDQAQQVSGKKLNREEKEILMRREIDRKVIYTEGFNTSLPAAAVRPDQRQSIYVDINEIPPNWLSGALNYLRSTGQISYELSDEKARVMYKDRLQRAYAVSLTGGSSEEGRAILEGKAE